MLIGNTHLICGDASILSVACAALARDGVSVSGPDAYVRAYGEFGIDEARELCSRAAMRPVSAPHRTFILAMPGMTVPAQNALLKTLEEPPAGAMFFFVLPSPDALLPTLRSRAQRLELSLTKHTHSAPDAERFLAASPEKRFAELAPLLKKNNDDKHDLGGILAFLVSLERALAECGATPALRAIYRARKYMNDKGALKKVLLEQVALLVPRV